MRRQSSISVRRHATFQFFEPAIHNELSRKGDEPLETRADGLRLVLLGQGWIELNATETAH